MLLLDRHKILSKVQLCNPFFGSGIHQTAKDGTLPVDYRTYSGGLVGMRPCVDSNKHYSLLGAAFKVNP